MRDYLVYESYTVGMPYCRYVCPCGHVGEWSRSNYRAKQAFEKHANVCDSALTVLLDLAQKAEEMKA